MAYRGALWIRRKKSAKKSKCALGLRPFHLHQSLSPRLRTLWLQSYLKSPRSLQDCTSSKSKLKQLQKSKRLGNPGLSAFTYLRRCRVRPPFSKNYDPEDGVFTNTPKLGCYLANELNNATCREHEPFAMMDCPTTRGAVRQPHAHMCDLSCQAFVCETFPFICGKQDGDLQGFSLGSRNS